MRWAALLCLGLSACSLALDFDTVQQPCDDQGKCLDGYTCDTASRKCVKVQRTTCTSDSQCSKTNAVCDGHYCTTDVVAVSGSGVVAPDLSCAGKTPAANPTYAASGCLVDAFAKSGANPPPFDSAAQLAFYQAGSGGGLGSQLATATLAAQTSCPGTATAYDATGTPLPGGTWLNASYLPGDVITGPLVTTYTERLRLSGDGGVSPPVYALGAAAFATLAGAQAPVLTGGIVVDCQGRPLANVTVKMTGTIAGDGGFAPGTVQYLNADGTLATSRKVTTRAGYFATFDFAESSTSGLVAQGTVNGATKTLANLYLFVPARPSSMSGLGAVAAWVRASP